MEGSGVRRAADWGVLEILTTQMRVFALRPVEVHTRGPGQPGDVVIDMNSIEMPGLVGQDEWVRAVRVGHYFTASLVQSDDDDPGSALTVADAEQADRDSVEDRPVAFANDHSEDTAIARTMWTVREVLLNYIDVFGLGNTEHLSGLFQWNATAIAGMAPFRNRADVNVVPFFVVWTTIQAQQEIMTSSEEAEDMMRDLTITFVPGLPGFDEEKPYLGIHPGVDPTGVTIVVDGPDHLVEAATGALNLFMIAFIEASLRTDDITPISGSPRTPGSGSVRPKKKTRRRRSRSPSPRGGPPPPPPPSPGVSGSNPIVLNSIGEMCCAQCRSTTKCSIVPCHMECEDVSYCSITCQRLHWRKGHGKRCSSVTK